MTEAAIIVFAGTESHADCGRVFNAVEATKEFVENGDDIELILGGAGTEWVSELEDPDHDFHALYREVRDEVGVCDFCAGAFEVSDAIDNAGVACLSECDGHPSLRSLVEDGCEVITF